MKLGPVQIYYSSPEKNVMLRGRSFKAPFHSIYSIPRLRCGSFNSVEWIKMENVVVLWVIFLLNKLAIQDTCNFLE